MLNITLGGIIYAWLENRSNSVWAVAVAHNTSNTSNTFNTFNTFIESLRRTAVTATPATAAYVAGESGIASTLAIAAVSLPWCADRPAMHADPRSPRQLPSCARPATGAAHPLPSDGLGPAARVQPHGCEKGRR